MICASERIIRLVYQVIKAQTVFIHMYLIILHTQQK